MAGNVYVFNVSNELLGLTVNFMPVGGEGIPGWSRGPDGYRPNTLAVPRSRHPDRGTFGNGPNGLRLSSRFGDSEVQVAIDGMQCPLDQDLLLFVTRNQWQLVSDRSVTLASGEV